MTHGEKLLLVVFVMTATATSGEGWEHVARIVLTALIGVLFANWPLTRKDKDRA